MNCNGCYNLDFYKRVGYIPSSYKVAMTYEEQLLWLCQQIETLKQGTANYNYDLLENKPSIDGVILQGNVTKSQLGIDMNYGSLFNKPSINSVVLQGNKSLNDLGIQAKLIAGSGISISGNTISATGGGGSGTSNYEMLTNKPSINGVALQGNLEGRNLYLQDELSIVWNSRLQYGKALNISNVQVGDTILPPYSSIIEDVAVNPEDNCIFQIDKHNGDYFDFTGNYDLISLDQANVVTSTFSSDGPSHGYFTSSGDGKLFVYFKDCSNNEPDVKQIETGMGNWTIHNILEKEEKSIYHDLKDVVEANYSYKNYSSELTTGKIYIPQLDNNVVLSDLTNGATIKIDKKIFSMINIRGKCVGYASILYLNSNNKIIDSYPANQNFNQYLKLNIPDGTNSIIFNFTDTNELTPELWLIDIDKYKTFKAITGDPLILLNNATITQNNNVINLETGIYVLNTEIYNNSILDENLVYGYGDIVIYDASEKAFYSWTKKTAYSFLQRWDYFQNENITNEIINDKWLIPTSQAVYNELQIRKTYSIEELKASDDEDILDEYKDGSLFIKDFVNDLVTPQVRTSLNSVFFWDTTDISAKWKSFSKASDTLESGGGGSYYYDSEFKTFDINNDGTNWSLTDRSFEIKRNAVDITPTTNANFIPTVGQVRNYVAANSVNYSTTEKVIGTWTDGKPLYEKTVTGTVPTVVTDGTAVSATYDITNNIDSVFIVTSFVNYSGGGSVWTLPFYNNDMYHLKSQIVKASNQRKIQFSSSGTVYNDSTFVIVVRYTKTTD